MLAQVISRVRDRWHPLWRLRQLPLYRGLQRLCDRTVYTRIPGTGLQVAVKLLRDASWIASPTSLEPEIRSAFDLVLEQLQPAVFWDVGANIGYYSWLVRRHPSVRQVEMFEPDPVNYGLIGCTLRRNKIANCETHQLALSDRAGETSFLVDRASGATGSLESISHRDNKRSLHHAYQLNETIRCTTETVDGLIAQGLPAPNFIKIDVEGAEHLVIAGAKSCLAEHRPALIVETTDMPLVQHVRDAGYQALRIDAGNVLFLPGESASLPACRDLFADAR